MGRYLFLENIDTYYGWLLKVWVIFTSSQKTYKYIVIILEQFLQMKICLILEGGWGRDCILAIASEDKHHFFHRHSLNKGYR